MRNTLLRLGGKMRRVFYGPFIDFNFWFLVFFCEEVELIEFLAGADSLKDKSETVFYRKCSI